MDALLGISDALKAPIAKTSADGKVETFERRLNGKFLPFVGLHGMLLALFYLVAELELSSPVDGAVPLWPVILLAVAALTSGTTAIVYHLRGRAHDGAGGAGVAVILAMVTSLLLPTGDIGVAVALAIFLTLLTLNARGWVSDYDTNTVFVYLPLMFFVVRDLPLWTQLLSAVGLFGAATFVKFLLQPQSNKVPLGFSMLVFLFVLTKRSGDEQLLASILVLLAMILFTVYGFRNRRATGSSYRHFLFDAIIMGLWGVLVATFEAPDDDLLVLWGIGVVIYQSVALVLLGLRGAADPGTLASSGARWVWIQIGVFASFVDYLVEGVLRQMWGVDPTYASEVGGLMILVVFIPVYHILKSRFLALATRIGISAGVLSLGVATCKDFTSRYVNQVDEFTPDMLRVHLLSEYQTDLFWLVFAFLVGLAATLRVPPAPEMAWWRGLIWARHMVLVRRAGRLIGANANRIAFVGGFIAALAALAKWIRYAAGEQQGAGSRALMLLCVFVFGVAMTILFGRYLESCCEPGAYPLLQASPLEFIEGDLVYVLSWCCWGTLFYLYGVTFKDCLARFFAISFVLMPLIAFDTDTLGLDKKVFLAEMVLACCFSLFSFGILRRVAR